MSTALALHDAAARERAVTELSADFLVEAGAGSGKTSLLVERMLQALLVQGAPLRRCAAITFTRKAAAELHNRLVQELEAFVAAAPGTAAPPPSSAAARVGERLEHPDARTAARARALDCLEDLDEAAIGTLHAFCAALLRRHPLAAGVPPHFQPDEGDALRALAERLGPALVAAELAETAPAVRARLAAFPAASILELAQEAALHPPAPLPEQADSPEDALALVAARSAARLQARLLAEGYLGMDSMVQRATELLEREPDIRRAERARWQHLLVDELQDTDPNQYALLLRLSHEPDEPGHRPRLFLVGDPKQSVYRFRRADLAAYARFRAQIGARGAILALDTNFRSRSRLLEPVNALFARVMRAEEGVQPAYVAIHPDPRNQDGPGQAPRVRVLAVPDGPNQADEVRAREAATVAAEILRRRARRALPWSDFLVLMPQFPGLPQLQEALHAAGIPFTVDGGKSFFKRAEIGDFAALLGAFLGPDADEEQRPRHRPALLAFLRSAVGGVCDAELAHYREAIGNAPFGHPPPDASACPTVADALARLAGWRAALAGCAQDEVPARLLARSGLRAAWGLRRNGAQAAANLDKAAESVAEDLRARAVPLRAAVEALADRLGQGEDADQGVSEENADAVTVLTVHKAKGLERRIVILCAFDGGCVPDERGLHLLVDQRLGYGVQVRKGQANALHATLAEANRRHFEAERLRLLYVALTRAREELVLVQGRADPKECARNPWLRALQDGWGYVPGQAPAPVDGVAFEPAAPSREDTAARPPGIGAAQAAAAVAAWERAPVSARPLHGWPSALGHAAPEAEFQPGADEDAAPLARAVGRSVHRLFELWDYRDCAALTAPLAAIAAAEAEKAGVAPESVVARARALLERLPQSACGRHLLALAGCERWPELPLLHQEEGITYSGAVDLLYRAADGRYVVADFKTDAGLDAAGAQRRYGAQLRLYGRALRAALALDAPPRLELLLLDSGAVVEVPPA
ncbi:MAG: hypothetical protein EYC70_15120 [Planctomycetota bacterium]|nr:MAG: hypothetical protein EYC70_15120 [Planctomycetota bacterium]